MKNLLFSSLCHTLGLYSSHKKIGQQLCLTLLSRASPVWNHSPSPLPPFVDKTYSSFRSLLSSRLPLEVWVKYPSNKVYSTLVFPVRIPITLHSNCLIDCSWLEYKLWKSRNHSSGCCEATKGTMANSISEQIKESSLDKESFRQVIKNESFQGEQ